MCLTMIVAHEGLHWVNNVTPLSVLVNGVELEGSETIMEAYRKIVVPIPNSNSKLNVEESMVRMTAHPEMGGCIKCD